MRPRMGAGALGALVATFAIALGVAPGIASADDNDSLVTFRLPSRAVVDQLIRLMSDTGVPLPTAFNAAPPLLALAIVGPIAKYFDLRYGNRNPVPQRGAAPA